MSGGKPYVTHWRDCGADFFFCPESITYIYRTGLVCHTIPVAPSRLGVYLVSFCAVQIHFGDRHLWKKKIIILDHSESRSKIKQLTAYAGCWYFEFRESTVEKQQHAVLWKAFIPIHIFCIFVTLMCKCKLKKNKFLNDDFIFWGKKTL